MVNALKKPVQFVNEEDEELSRATVSKSKRIPIAVFFVFLGIAGFILFPDQKETQEPGIIASSENSAEKTVTSPTEEQKTEPLPAQTKSEQTKQTPVSEQVHSEPSSSSIKEDKKEFAFKNDKEYLAMNRFERPSRESKVPEVNRRHVRKTTTAVDKPLVLAGRGFDIQGFQSLANQVVRADFLQHLNRPVPKVKPVRLERLDLQLTQAKRSRHLIFHPLGPTLSQFQKPAQWETPHSRNNPQDLQPVPETKLLFGENKRSELILRSGSESLDLMIGNEKINRKEFGSW